jgi:hypothetical protein
MHDVRGFIFFFEGKPGAGFFTEYLPLEVNLLPGCEIPLTKLAVLAA